MLQKCAILAVNGSSSNASKSISSICFNNRIDRGSLALPRRIHFNTNDERVLSTAAFLRDYIELRDCSKVYEKKDIQTIIDFVATM